LVLGRRALLKILSDGGLIEQSAPKKEAALYRELN
jgi:hypothetical protein